LIPLLTNLESKGINLLTMIDDKGWNLLHHAVFKG